jgi:hypothetical protein
MTYSFIRIAKCEEVVKEALVEGPFATVRAFLHIYPSLKLRTVATMSAAIVNGTHRPAHKVRLHLPHTLSLMLSCFLSSVLVWLYLPVINMTLI